MEKTTRPWRPVLVLLAGHALVKSCGFAYVFMGYYLAEDLQSSLAATGAVLAAWGVGRLIGGPLVGALADALGYRATLRLAMLITAASCAALATLSTWTAVLVPSILGGAFSDAQRVAIAATAGDLLTAHRSRARASTASYWVLNVATSACAAVGGPLALAIGYRPLLLINAAACAVYAIAAQAVPAHLRGVRTPGDWRRTVTDRPLQLLFLASLGAAISAVGVSTTVPLLMADDHLSVTAFSVVQLVNTLGVVLLTWPLQPWLERRRPERVMAAGSLLLGAAMAAVTLQDSTLGYALCIAVAVPGEIAYCSASGTLLMTISPPGLRGRFAGLYDTHLSLAIIVAPLLAAATFAAGAIAAAGLLGAAACLPLAGAVRNRAVALLATDPPALSEAAA